MSYFNLQYSVFQSDSLNYREFRISFCHVKKYYLSSKDPPTPEIIYQVEGEGGDGNQGLAHQEHGCEGSVWD